MPDDFVVERGLVKGFEELWTILGGGPESLALVAGDDAHAFMVGAASWRGVAPTSVGDLLTVEDPEGWKYPERLLRGSQVLIDIDVLFWPTIMVDPLRLLRGLSRRHPLIVHWPGQIANGHARYSEPGRRDYYDEPLDREVLVRPRPISSSTDTFYDLEIAQ